MLLQKQVNSRKTQNINIPVIPNVLLILIYAAGYQITKHLDKAQ